MKKLTIIAAAILIAVIAAFGVTGLAGAATVLVGERVQGENLVENSPNVSPFTGTSGEVMMRWTASSTSSDVASYTFDPTQSIDQMVIQSRQASGGTGSMDVVVDGAKVGSFTPSNAGFAPNTVNLSTTISANVEHTVVLKPSAALTGRIDVDWLEFYSSDSTPPPPAACANGNDDDGDGKIDLSDPGCSSSTDNDETDTALPGVNLPDKVQAETGTLSGGTVINTGDANDEGDSVRYPASSPTSAKVDFSKVFNQNVTKLSVRARASVGDEDIGVYVNGNLAATVSNVPTAWSTLQVPISIPQGQQVTVSFRPATNLSSAQRIWIDWVTFDGGTTPPPPVDTDGDGVTDDVDQCDTQPGPASNNGCPVTTSSVGWLGAGDIADTNNIDAKTANLLQARMVSGDRVFTLGDDAYNDGSTSDFANKYDPDWGRSSIFSVTDPVPGNHEYHTAGAQGYKSYFGSKAVRNGNTYYAVNHGAWRIYFLDSELPSTTSSAQYSWLQNDLNANRKGCMAAVWHYPVASTGEHGSLSKMRAVFSLLDNSTNDADLVLVGHDHDYERTKPIDSTGTPTASGITEVVVGTGGTDLRPFAGSAAAFTQVRNDNSHGILDFNLSSTGATGNFVPVAGDSFTDNFSVSCN